ncbi:MAG TPA: hypothetical protein EYG74_07340 [Sulfurimonas autotrophica]|nr:hypothetical protein [Sulfurimonas autotrophica]
MKKGKRHLQKMAKLLYAKEMLQMNKQGMGVRKIANEINRRLKLSKKFRLENGEPIQLSKTTIADFMKKFRTKYRGEI